MDRLPHLRKNRVQRIKLSVSMQLPRGQTRFLTCTIVTPGEPSPPVGSLALSDTDAPKHPSISSHPADGNDYGALNSLDPPAQSVSTTSNSSGLGFDNKSNLKTTAEGPPEQKIFPGIVHGRAQRSNVSGRTIIDNSPNGGGLK